MTFNFEDYRQPWETGPHWELKREFMDTYQNDFPVDRLLCLAQAYSNIELLNCSYPEPVMRQVHELSKSMHANKRFREMKEKLAKDKAESQSHKGKRNSEDSSNQKYKFIKFTSAAEQSFAKPEEPNFSQTASDGIDTTEKDPLNNLSIPEKNVVDETSNAIISDNLVLSLSNSLDFPLIEKIAEEVRKLGTNRNPCEQIESAVQILEVNHLVNHKFVNTIVNRKPVYRCEFYIGNTLMSIGRDNNERNAQLKAAEYAMDIFLNLTNLPHKALIDLKNELQRTILSLPEMRFIQKFLYEAIKFLGNQSTIDALQHAAFNLHHSSEFVYFATEDHTTPLHNRTFLCDLVLKRVLISQGKGSSKKKAKYDAAAQVIRNLTSFDDFIKELLSKKQSECNDKDSTRDSSKLCLTKSILSENMTDDLNCKLVDTKPQSYCVKKKLKLQIKRQRINRTSVNLCGSSEDVKNEDWSIDAVNRTISQSNLTNINHRLLNNSLQRNLVILDTSEVKWLSGQQTPAGILNYSAAFCQKSMQFDYDEVTCLPGEPKIIRCHVLFNEEVVGTGASDNKLDAKVMAAGHTLENLQKMVYTVKVKNELEEGFVINHTQVLNADVKLNTLSDSNVGCKMMKLMGWSGGSIGKAGGITEPIKASEHRFQQGLGFADDRGKMKSFSNKIEALIKDYSQSITLSDLIFSTDFQKEERKEIHRIATKYGLLSNSRGKGDQRQLFIRRKFTIPELLKHLVQAGGSLHKYELVDKSSAHLTSLNEITSM